MSTDTDPYRVRRDDHTHVPGRPKLPLAFETAVMCGPLDEPFLLDALDYFTATADVPYLATKYGTYLLAEIKRLKRELSNKDNDR